MARSSTISASRRGELAALGAVLVIALVLRLQGITSQSLWYDEGSSLEFSSGSSVGRVIANLLATDSSERYQPLYFVVLHGWRALFGDDEAALRLLSVFCGTASVCFLALAVRTVFGRAHALASAVLMTTSAYGVYYSQEIRPYAFLLMLASLQLWSLLASTAPRCEERHRRWLRRLFWTATTISLFGGLFMVLFTGALGLAQLAAERKPRSWLRAWLPLPALALPSLCYYAWAFVAAASARNEGVNAIQQPLWQNVLFVLYGIVAGTTYGPPLDALRGPGKLAALHPWELRLGVLGLVAAGGVALAWTTVCGWPRADPRRRASVFFAWLAVLSLAFGIGLALATRFNWLPRHAFSLSLPIAALAPLVLERTGDTARPILRRILGIATFSAIVLINLVSTHTYLHVGAHRRDDYRAAARYLAAHRSEANPQVLLWGKPSLLEYYGATGVIDGTRFPKQGLRERLRSATGDAPAFVIVLNRAFYWDDATRTTLERLLAPEYVLTSEPDPFAAGFSLYGFERNVATEAGRAG